MLSTQYRPVCELVHTPDATACRESPVSPFLAAHSLKLHTIEPRGSATTGRMIRVALLLLSGLLAGCATASSPTASVDVRALCEELTRASASSPERIDKNYFSQCMIAHGASAEAGQTKGP
jgi:hypothetical protein